MHAVAKARRVLKEITWGVRGYWEKWAFFVKPVSRGGANDPALCAYAKASNNAVLWVFFVTSGMDWKLRISIIVDMQKWNFKQELGKGVSWKLGYIEGETEMDNQDLIKYTWLAHFSFHYSWNSVSRWYLHQISYT